MEKIEISIFNKIEKLKSNYIDYDKRGLETHKKHCEKQLLQCRKMLEILH